MLYLIMVFIPLDAQIILHLAGRKLVPRNFDDSINLWYFFTFCHKISHAPPILSLSHVWNQTFLKEALIPFIGEWQRETKSCVLNVLTATEVLLLPASFVAIAKKIMNSCSCFQLKCNIVDFFLIPYIYFSFPIQQKFWFLITAHIYLFVLSYSLHKIVSKL